MQKETAEQKLLKIIEASKKTSTQEAKVSVSTKSSSRLSFTIRHLNGLLVVALVAAVFYFIVELNNGFALISDEASISPEGTNKTVVSLKLPQQKNISVYLNQMSMRDLFKPYEAKDTTTSPMSSDKAVLEKKMSEYRLVGIAWLDVPETVTVMIENKANKTTRFLKEGDKIDDVTVKTIFTNKVVFSYANEEIVIKL